MTYAYVIQNTNMNYRNRYVIIQFNDSNEKYSKSRGHFTSFTGQASRSISSKGNHSVLVELCAAKRNKGWNVIMIFFSLRVKYTMFMKRSSKSLALNMINCDADRRGFFFLPEVESCSSGFLPPFLWSKSIPIGCWFTLGSVNSQ